MTSDSLLENSKGCWKIVRACRLLRSRVGAVLAAYYLLTPVSATADGVSWILLFRAFSTAGASSFLDQGGGVLSTAIARHCPEDPAELMLLICALFAFRAFSTIALTFIEGWLQAMFRREIQGRAFETILYGRWEAMRGQSVGQWVGSITEEAATIAKYLMFFIKGVFSAVSFAILGAMALLIAPRFAVALGLVGVPAWLALRLLYSHQMRLSTRFTQARVNLSADLTERMTGLYQIKAAGDMAAHLKTGLRRQQEMTRMEVLLAGYNGLLTAFNPIVIAVGLGVLYFRARAGGSPLTAQLAAFGSVGILGFRAVSQLNTLIATLGNMTRLSGSIEPVLRMLQIPADAVKQPVGERLARVRLEDVRYAIGGRVIVDRVSASADAGRLFLISGPSGAGKTTLANLISGLYEPESGRILYTGVSGRTYDGATHKPRIGYVTQDVHLFKGTMRQNLDPFGMSSDQELWAALAATGAKAFVERRGGLDAEVSEAGRSLSGGEKRRLAMARALAQRTDCLILDEVTNGLDETTKGELLSTIAELSRGLLVLAISHDLDAFARIEHVPFTVAPRRRETDLA